MKKLDLEVKQVRGRWCIVAGESVLDRFKTEQEATKALQDGRLTYEFWAGSAGVAIQNTPPKIVTLGDGNVQPS